jgi:hypothetical protein
MGKITLFKLSPQFFHITIISMKDIFNIILLQLPQGNHQLHRKPEIIGLKGKQGKF